MKILGKRLIIKEIEQESTKSDIILVDKERPTVFSAEVIEAGEETQFKKGQTVLVNRYQSDPIIWEGIDMYLTLEEHIIAVK